MELTQLVFDNLQTMKKKKKPEPPLYVIRRLENSRQRELLATTEKTIADAYWASLQKANVTNITFTIYE